MVVCHAFEVIQMAWNRVTCQPGKQAAQLPVSQEILGAVPLLYRTRQSDDVSLESYQAVTGPLLVPESCMRVSLLPENPLLGGVAQRRGGTFAANTHPEAFGF